MDGHDDYERLGEVTASVRRQTVILMVALNQHDDDLAVLASSRIREALNDGRRLATRIATKRPHAASGAAAMLEAAWQTAARWLERAPIRLAGVDEALRLLARFGGAPVAVDQDIADLNIEDLDLADTSLTGLTLRNVRGQRSILVRVDATGARIVGCDFSKALASIACFDGAAIEDCAFARAALDRTSWCGARVARSSFGGSILADASVDGATFTDCDLRAADLGIVNSTIPQGPVRVAFVRCDLRETNWDGRSLVGALFTDCKLHGIRGVPSHVEGITIERPDLSVLGDRTQWGSRDDVLQLWNGGDVCT